MLDIERFESKYKMDRMEAVLIQKRLEQYIAQDPYSKGDGYLVRSVYFDTIFNKDFYAREESLTHRHHIRLRTYPEKPDLISLEYKEKNSATVRKRSLPVTRQEAGSLLRADYSVLRSHKSPFARMLYRKMTLETYRPCVLIEYRRKAYVRKENNIRITFDSSLRAEEARLDLFGSSAGFAPVGRQSQVIMELKYSDFFMSDLKSAIGTKLLRAEPSGKYQRARMIFMSGRNYL
ncbi:MAG: polyphosphate polymerase domain-containing protein [Clostridia bacterium]|nr:polyphosphate polymerase domain-containing protein [Clostridia bacterium]